MVIIGGPYKSIEEMLNATMNDGGATTASSTDLLGQVLGQMGMPDGVSGGDSVGAANIAPGGAAYHSNMAAMLAARGGGGGGPGVG